LILFFFNILTLALYLSFKYLSFSINFFIIIIITFLLTILLFRFFENVKKLKEKKE
jgi:membrane protein implicated in regulation of membrane protease activity